MFVGFGWTVPAAEPVAPTSPSRTGTAIVAHTPFAAAVMDLLDVPVLRNMDFRLAFRKTIERIKETSGGRCWPWMEVCVDAVYFCL